MKWLPTCVIRCRFLKLAAVTCTSAGGAVVGAGRRASSEYELPPLHAATMTAATTSALPHTQTCIPIRRASAWVRTRRSEGSSVEPVPFPRRDRLERTRENRARWRRRQVPRDLERRAVEPRDRDLVLVVGERPRAGDARRSRTTGRRSGAAPLPASGSTVTYTPRCGRYGTAAAEMRTRGATAVSRDDERSRQQRRDGAGGNVRAGGDRDPFDELRQRLVRPARSSR